MTRFFALKASLAGAGLVVGLLGIAAGLRWLVWAAVACLAVAFAVRFAERERTL